MRSDRPCRAALPLLEARLVLVQNSGSQFDPEVTRTLLEMLDEGEPVTAPRAGVDTLGSAGVAGSASTSIA